MNLRELAIKLKSAREKATQGEITIYRMDGPCGYFNFMAETDIKDDDSHIVAHFSEVDNMKSKNNSAFFELSANHTTELCDALLECIETLEELTGIEFAASMYLTNPSEKNGEIVNAIVSYEVADRFMKARETLKKLGVV